MTQKRIDLLKAEGSDRLEESARIGATLLQWYDVNARALPWRDDPTPYRVWVSEIMLQQTRVEAGIPYFERFVREIPTVEALAAVPDDALMKLWEGLGYYHRARNLKKAASMVLRDFGGELPSGEKELLSLPGIGKYTAGAIASIAFGEPRPAVDGNVIRVLSRLDAVGGDPSGSAFRQRIEKRAAELLPDRRTGDFNQALMELGATVCIPGGSPRCPECPINPFCSAHHMGIAGALPEKTKKKSRRTEYKTVFVITDGTRTALRRRPEQGLLAGLWEFPCADGTLRPDETGKLLTQWNIGVHTLAELKTAKHVFSHLEWHMTGYFVRADRISEDTEVVWVPNERLLSDYPIPSAYKVYLNEWKKYFEEKYVL